MYAEINDLIKNAMLAKDADKLKVLRLVKSEFLRFNAQPGQPVLDEAAEIQILKKMVKQRKDSVDAYVANGRQDLADVEQAEIDVINGYLPSGPSESEIKLFIDEIVKASQNNMGGYIKEVKAKFPTADGSLVAKLVKEAIV